MPETKLEAQVETPADTASTPSDRSKRIKQIALDGLLYQNPILVLFLGMCATLAVSTSLTNALGMGLSTTAVLVCSNIVISLLRKAIPKQVRIACYVVIIAGFVTIVDLVMQAYLPALSESLGLFIPLIVVNCIILGRAEAFASKNGAFDSILDGVGIGLGFTFSLTVIGALREILGGGAIFGYQLGISDYTPLIFVLAPGAFFVLGYLMVLFNKYLKK